MPEIDPGEEASTDGEHPAVVVPVEKAHVTSGLGAPRPGLGREEVEVVAVVAGGVSQLELPLGDGDEVVVLAAGQDADDAAGVEVVRVGTREEVERRWRRGGAAAGLVDEDVGERPPGVACS
ncbi:hypothetical protein SEVIR_9G206755v4 [Setaria viridis]